MVSEVFKSLAGRYTENTLQVDKLATEIVKCYSEKGRYYHNLDHLDAVLQQILPLAGLIQDLDMVLFALYYHDAIYNVLRKDNEMKSAELAKKRLSTLHVAPERIDRCTKHILATKVHEFSDNTDTNFFTDADLSILGQEWNTYNRYTEGVRKEYWIYPDLIYKPGRKKVVEHFLKMKKIYKTDPLSARYEHQAKLNLTRELDNLIT